MSYLKNLLNKVNALEPKMMAVENAIGKKETSQKITDLLNSNELLYIKNSPFAKNVKNCCQKETLERYEELVKSFSENPSIGGLEEIRSLLQEVKEGKILKKKKRQGVSFVKIAN